MKYLFENWRKLLEGDVIQGPWGSTSSAEEEAEEGEVSRNAMIANDIEDSITNHMNSVYANDWNNDQIEAFEQINKLLNVLFPSGE